jgi:hypothetical protein
MLDYYINNFGALKICCVYFSPKKEEDETARLAESVYRA